jgi:hypothetical protein
MTRYAEGGNFRFDLERAIVTCKVWSRPDVDRETGARFAREKTEHFEKLIALPRAIVKACIFDLREAPTSWGPATQASLERCVELWEQTARRIAVVASSDALQLLHLRLLVRDRAPQYGKLFADADEALEWLLQ